MKQKAAMFGLDARVALAIFGALSIITGAALYNALQHIKTVKYHQFFNEIVKASEAYYLDNGKPLSQYSCDPSILNGSDLLVNKENLLTWKGPYVDFLGEDGYIYFFILKRVFGVKIEGEWFLLLYQIGQLMISKIVVLMIQTVQSG